MRLKIATLLAKLGPSETYPRIVFETFTSSYALSVEGFPIRIEVMVASGIDRGLKMIETRLHPEDPTPSIHFLNQSSVLVNSNSAGNWS